MAAHETSQLQSLTTVGELRLLPDPCTYSRRVARTAGLLAHQLMYGSDRRESDILNGIPVSISVSVGNNSSFYFPRVHGAALNRTEPDGTGGYLVAAESHSLTSFPDTLGCTSSDCGVARGLVVLSPIEDVATKGIKGAVSATPDLWSKDGWELDRVLDATHDGASGYGDSTPLDPRESELAREVLTHMRQQGHMFLDPTLEAYATDLVGPVPALAQ